MGPHVLQTVAVDAAGNVATRRAPSRSGRGRGHARRRLAAARFGSLRASSSRGTRWPSRLRPRVDSRGSPASRERSQRTLRFGRRRGRSRGRLVDAAGKPSPTPRRVTERSVGAAPSRSTAVTRTDANGRFEYRSHGRPEPVVEFSYWANAGDPAPVATSSGDGSGSGWGDVEDVDEAGAERDGAAVQWAGARGGQAGRAGDDLCAEQRASEADSRGDGSGWVRWAVQVQRIGSGRSVGRRRFSSRPGCRSRPGFRIWRVRASRSGRLVRRPTRSGLARPENTIAGRRAAIAED